MYEVRRKYFTYHDFVFAITDDLTYARTLLLKAAFEQAGPVSVARGQRDFEISFAEFVSGKRGVCCASYGEHHYEIRESQLIVAVGGMSTIGATP